MFLNVGQCAIFSCLGRSAVFFYRRLYRTDHSQSKRIRQCLALKTTMHRKETNQHKAPKQEATNASLPKQTAMRITDLDDVFSDLERVPQDDGPTAVCRIEYTDDFIHAHDYFRAVQQRNELSSRALDLTTLCLQLNPANYTVWHYRRQCLQALDLYNDPQQMNRDLQMAALLGGQNPKNYQIWYHRRAFLEELEEENLTYALKNELTYIANVIQSDGKNYHAWSHRQWVLSALNDAEMWAQELEYTSSLIERDIRNNSAWNGRWFVLHRGEGNTGLDSSVAQQQMEFSLSVAKEDPHNPSPWRFLLAIVKEQQLSNPEKQEIVNKIKKIREEIVPNDPCPALLSTLVDLSEPSVALQHIESLKECDPIRVKYWNYRQSKLTESVN